MPEPQFLLTLTHLPPDISPSLLGQTVRLKNLPTTIGRGKDAGITVKHRSLSRLHCRFYLTDGRLAVKDLASTNGTLINGHRISEDSYLQVGDQITFGSIVFQVSLLKPDVPQRMPEPVPDSATNAATLGMAAAQLPVSQPATDRIPSFVPDQPVPEQPSAQTENSSEIPLDLIQKAAPTSQDIEPELEMDLVKLLEDSDEMEADLASLIDDSDAIGDKNAESLDDDAQDFSPLSANSLEKFRSSSKSINNQPKVPKQFRAEDSVVFFESNPIASLPQDSDDSSMVDPAEVQQAGEREMAVEGVALREDIADVMKRHNLNVVQKSQQIDENPIAFDVDADVTSTPIILDRKEDQRSVNPDSINSKLTSTANDVIDFEVPGRGPTVTSINIETSFVAGSSNIDLGDFMKGQLTGRPDIDDLVIDEPTGKDASMTALGDFFKKKKD